MATPATPPTATGATGVTQWAPAAGVRTDSYQCAAGVSVYVTSISMCNVGTDDAVCEISLALAGAAYAGAQNLYQNYPVPFGETREIPLGGRWGMLIGALDLIRLKSDTGGVNFQVNVDIA